MNDPKTTASGISVLLEEVGASTVNAKNEQDDARQAVIAAIRTLERVLRERLHGNTIRGLKNIGLGKDAFYAAYIRGDSSDKKIRWPEEPNSTTEALVIVPDGRLQFALCQTDEDNAMLVDIDTRDVADGELQVEDLEKILRAYAEIIPRHIAYAAKAKERYAGLRDLSDKVLRLLGDEVE